MRIVKRKKGFEGNLLKRKRRYYLYGGETSEVLKSLLRREDGAHGSRAGSPNET